MESESDELTEYPGDMGDGGILSGNVTRFVDVGVGIEDRGKTGSGKGTSSGEGAVSGEGADSGEGGNGGSFKSSRYCLVCLGRFGLDGGGNGPERSDLLRRVLTIQRHRRKARWCM